MKRLFIFLLYLFDWTPSFATDTQLGWTNPKVEEQCSKLKPDEIKSNAKMMKDNGLEMLVTYWVQVDCMDQDSQVDDFHPANDIGKCKSDAEKAAKEKIANIAKACEAYCLAISKKVVETPASNKMRSLSQWRNHSRPKWTSWQRKYEFIGKCE